MIINLPVIIINYMPVIQWLNTRWEPVYQEKTVSTLSEIALKQLSGLDGQTMLKIKPIFELGNQFNPVLRIFIRIEAESIFQFFLTQPRWGW